MASPRCRRIALAAGALSYPVYALHEPMIAPFMHLQQRPAAMTMALFIAAFLGVSAVGAAALRWADMPARRWLGQLAEPGRAIVPKDGSAAD
jgi:peptidoglycan/LPS O-acetylase OafA/YrhL